MISRLPCSIVRLVNNCIVNSDYIVVQGTSFESGSSVHSDIHAEIWRWFLWATNCRVVHSCSEIAVETQSLVAFCHIFFSCELMIQPLLLTGTQICNHPRRSHIATSEPHWCAGTAIKSGHGSRTAQGKLLFERLYFQQPLVRCGFPSTILFRIGRMWSAHRLLESNYGLI